MVVSVHFGKLRPREWVHTLQSLIKFGSEWEQWKRGRLLEQNTEDDETDAVLNQTKEITEADGNVNINSEMNNELENKHFFKSELLNSIMNGLYILFLENSIILFLHMC